MFTGIIEELGIVKNFVKTRGGSRLEVSARTVLKDAKAGDSIAVNGVCLTANKISGEGFTAEILAETVNKTNFGSLKKGDEVNLERALTLSGRLGGHMVTGHVDGTGVIDKKMMKNTDTVLEISCPEELMKFIVKKGSVAIEGVSLTVVEILKGGFSVHLIVHTLEKTNLRAKKTGDSVNIETDIMGKYVEKIFASRGNEKITEDLLKREGFI